MINAKLMLSCYLLEEVLEERLNTKNLSKNEKDEIINSLLFINRLMKIELIINPYKNNNDAEEPEEADEENFDFFLE